MSAPNLFILGPHKCGTSALYAELLRRPQIRPLVTKETFYLVDRGSPFFNHESNYRTCGEDGWKHLGAPRDDSRCGYVLEASTHHVFQQTACEYLAARPETRGLIVLRDPARRIRSSFYYSKHNLASVHPSITFARYVDDLLRGSPLPYVRQPSSRWVLSRELTFSDYRTVLAYWRPLIHRDQVRVWTLEQFVRAPHATFSEVSHWLGLPEGPVSQLEQKNVTYLPRSHALHRLARRVNRGLRNFLPMRQYASMAYHAIMTSRLEFGDDSAPLEKLTRRYAPDYEQLRSEYGIDTTAWGG